MLVIINASQGPAFRSNGPNGYDAMSLVWQCPIFYIERGAFVLGRLIRARR